MIKRCNTITVLSAMNYPYILLCNIVNHLIVILIHHKSSECFQCYAFTTDK